MPPRGAAEILFGAYRRQVLALLLLRPEESFYVREISRMTGVPTGSLHRELKQLTNADILIRRSVGNQVRYQANQALSIYPELAGIFRKTAGLADILRDALDPLGKEIDLAFVFGSMAQGTEHATSDVDVFVIGSASFTDVVKAFATTHNKLGREINPVVMNRTQVQSAYEQNDRFVLRVTKEPKIFFIGSDDDFGQLTENRPTQGTSA